MNHLTLGAAALCLSFNFFAQPVIQGSGLNATAGETFTTYASAYVNPGSAGNNVTWNLSAMTNNSITTNVYSGANAGFPGSNIISTISNGGQTQSIYYDFSAGGQSWYGLNAGGVVFTYQNPMKQIAFPLSMNATHSDYFAATFTSGVAFNRYGTITSEVDGYGTLITPEGTFTDVLRVHLVQDYKDSNAFVELEYLVHIYAWYKSGIHNELASVSSLVSQNGTQQYGSYLEATSLGITEEARAPLAIYPNPATTATTIVLADAAPVNTFVVTDLQGKTHEVTYSQENTALQLDVASLSKGVYFVTVEYASGLVQQGKLSVN